MRFSHLMLLPDAADGASVSQNCLLACPARRFRAHPTLETLEISRAESGFCRCRMLAPMLMGSVAETFSVEALGVAAGCVGVLSFVYCLWLVPVTVFDASELGGKYELVALDDDTPAGPEGETKPG